MTTLAKGDGSLRFSGVERPRLHEEFNCEDIGALELHHSRAHRYGQSSGQCEHDVI
jgi:hypothetical protein